MVSSMHATSHGVLGVVGRMGYALDNFGRAYADLGISRERQDCTAIAAAAPDPTAFRSSPNSPPGSDCCQDSIPAAARKERLISITSPSRVAAIVSAAPAPPRPG